jgi:hypothetical protein
MAICGEVLTACVVAAEVTQAWYLAMDSTHNKVLM